MKMNRIYIAAILTSAGCSSLPSSEQTRGKIELLQDALVTIGSNTSTLKKQGESVSLETSAILLESPGHIGVLIVPQSSANKDTNLKIKLKPIEEWSGDAFLNKVDTSLSEVIYQYNEAQVLIGENRAKEALTKINMILSKYPNVSFLSFLKASCLYLMGDIRQAQHTLQEAVLKYPNDVEGKALYLKLSRQEKTP